MPRKRPATSEIARQLLDAFDSADPQDLEALRQTLTRLQETLLASRNQLEQHLRLYPEDLLQETLLLDNRHRLLAFEKLFYGTIDGCSVHPREVVKRTIQLNAAAVVFGHNHPSGEPEPSMADRNLTDRLKQALALVDVRVLDHIVVGGTEAVPFAERGML